mgnify:CR=1 FL=1
MPDDRRIVVEIVGKTREKKADDENRDKKDSKKSIENVRIAMKMLQDPVGAALMMARRGAQNKKAKEKGDSTTTASQVSNQIAEAQQSGETKKTPAQTAGLVTLDLLTMGWQSANQIIKGEINYNLNRKYSLTEDYLAQQAKTNTMRILDQTINVVTSTVSGAMSGAMIGHGVGAVFGAIFGATSSIYSAVSERRSTGNQAYAQLNATNAQTSYSATRFGLTDGGRGTLE